MHRNGHDPSRDLLRRESDERRDALRRTAHALEDRVRNQSHRVKDMAERTRGKMEGLDEVVARNRYWIASATFGVGLLLGLRKTRGHYVAPDMDRAVRFVVEPQRPTLLRSVLGGAAALTLRQGMMWASRRLTTEGNSAARPDLETSPEAQRAAETLEAYEQDEGEVPPLHPDFISPGRSNAE